MSKLSETLPGTWQLESRRDVTESGEHRIDPTLGADPVAILFHDRAGHFSAQFMKRDRSGATVDATASGANNSRTVGGYDAYFGSYKVDDASGEVTQVLLGLLSKESVGMTVSRGMAVDGDTLTMRPGTTATTGEPVTRTLIWKRVG